MENIIQMLFLCEKILRQVGEVFWADKIKRVLQANGDDMDIYFAEEILSWFGGMGSFNDLLISKYNGHSVSDAVENKLNAELNGLRGKIYQEAARLKRQLAVS